MRANVICPGFIKKEETMFDISNSGLKKGCLDGEVAVITGSTSNVGKGFAQAIAWAGGKVVIVGRGKERGMAVVDEINADCGEGTAIFVQADVSNAEDVAKLKEEAYSAFGKVDILINNAMDMSLNYSILESPVEDLDRAYGISARAFMLTAHAFVPDMVKRGHGTVTFSTTQFHYIPGMLGGSVYTAAKAAATSACMSLSNEVRDTGVHVFCFQPAGVGPVRPNSVKVVTEDGKAVYLSTKNTIIKAYDGMFKDVFQTGCFRRGNGLDDPPWRRDARNRRYGQRCAQGDEVSIPLSGNARRASSSVHGGISADTDVRIHDPWIPGKRKLIRGTYV